jgi:hypothetical protein
MNKCVCIIQSGPRRGEECGAALAEKRKRCGRHKKTCVRQKAGSPKLRRREIGAHESPPVGQNELDLRLYDKLEADLEKLSKTEAIMWRKHTEVEFGMKKILAPIKQRIKKVYKEFGDCFLEPVMHIGLPEGLVYFKKDDEAVEKLDFSGVIQQIQKCIAKEDSKLVAMRVEVHQQGTEVHAHALVINKKLKRKVVELYDPNGYEIHEKWYGTKVVEALKKLFESVDKDYIVAPMDKSNPPKGLQYFETLSKKLGAEFGGEYERYAYIHDYIEDGLCQAWALYMIELRARNADMPVSHFAVRIQNRLTAIMKKSNADLSGDPVANYIILYLHAGQNVGK